MSGSGPDTIAMETGAVTAASVAAVGGTAAEAANERELLVYLDVDGPLNPWAAKATRRPLGYETHRLLPESHVRERVSMGEALGRVKPLRVWLNPNHGRMLLDWVEQLGELGRIASGAWDSARLVWATTWEHEADEMIAPLVGLPRGLEVVEWTGRKRWTATPDGPLMFKTPQLVAHASGRPFVWLDDEIRPADRAYVAAEHRGRGGEAGIGVLRRVDPAIGLGRIDLDTIAVGLRAAVAAAAANTKSIGQERRNGNE